MHSSILLSILPLLATGLALPQQEKSGSPLPLPAILRRQNALELPPSLNTISGPITELPSPTITAVPTAIATASVTEGGEYSIAGPTPTPVPIHSLWQINTVPQTLIAQQQPQDNPADTVGAQEATITSSPTALATPLSNSDTQDDLAAAQGVDEGDINGGMLVNSIENPGTITNGPTAPSPAITAMATAEAYQGDSLLDPTTPISAMSETLDITAMAAAITSMVASASVSSMTSSVSITSTPTSMSSWSTSFSSQTTPTSISPASTSAAVTGSGSIKVAENRMETGTSNGNSTDDPKKGKKIRYKHCSETKGTVTEIKVEPCEGGKGTILDPCHFQAGRNYTITLSYVSPEDSTSPRANLVARDKTRSDGEERFTYTGQAFDACQYTSCPIKNQETQSYIYNFETLNNRFDQLTFNMTNGLDGDSLMCAYFPITFMPNLAGRSQRRNLPLGGLGSRW